jgi:hypothetical protein
VVRINPGPQHPERTDVAPLDDAAQSGGMVAIRVGDDHVIDRPIAIMGHDVVDDLVRHRIEATIHYVDQTLARHLVAHRDSVPALAGLNIKEVDLEKVGHCALRAISCELGCRPSAAITTRWG